MELRDLRTFLQVTDSGSITAAAAELHLVQSAVSQAVARLERELDVRLLERRPDGARPTEAGGELARHAADLLARAAQTELAMAAYRESARARVRLGLPPSVVPLLLSSLLRELHNRYPDLVVHVDESLVANLLAALRAGQLDLALLWQPMDAALEMGHLANVPLLLVAAGDHRLAGTGTASMADLRDESWVTFPHGGPGYGWIEAACKRGGYSPRIAAELPRLDEITAYVQAGMGITLLPAAAVRLEVAAGRLLALPLEAPTPVASLGYVKRRGAGNVSADRVIELARELLSNGSGP